MHFRFGNAQIALPAEEAMESSISSEIWRGSLLTAAMMAGLSVDEHPVAQLPEQASSECAFVPVRLLPPPVSYVLKATSCPRRWNDLDVLELGCGRGLPGVVAVAFGARHVVLTDCDDRALVGLEHVLLQPKDSAGTHRLNHLLWEQDANDEVADPLLPYERVRHWSDRHSTSRFASLPFGEQFDLVIASDCLYFESQEVPLAAALRCRVRKPDGVALVVVQTRANGGFQVVRLTAELQDSGFDVVHEQGPWDWETMLDRHVYSVPGQERAEVARTANEVGDLHVLTVVWRN